jgi:beta-lactamase regulating signal transducer with metallopeptidase domain/protein involved in polysaccharide export with SLBB domain
MNTQDLALALARTTLATTAACGLAWLLLTKLRIDSPRVHRLAWTLAILQGWLLFPWTLEIAAPPTSVTRDAVAERVHSPPASLSFTVENQSALQTQRSHRLLDSSLLAAFPVAAWFTGAIALAIAGVYRYARVLGTLPLGSPPDDPVWQNEWRRQLDAVRIPSHRRVDLRMTSDLGPLLCWTPWTYLVFAPKTLWAALTSPERQSILRHELAHLQRGDLWKSLAIRVLALPQWFNPMARLAVRRFDEAGEWACDDAAAGVAAGGPIAFANSLLHAAEFTSAELPGSVAAKGGVLSRRIHRLVTPRFKEESKMKRLIVPLLLLTATAAQLVRIERVGAESVTNSSRSNVEETSAIVDGAVVKTTAATEVVVERDADFDSLAKSPYLVEPPDILLIEILNFTPQAPRPLEKSDTVLVRIEGALPEQPIDYACNIDADGAIDLGPTHGRVRVVDLTVEESEAAIRNALSKTLSNVKVSAWMPDTTGGQYLVQADGRVTLDALGSVSVAGMTLDRARQSIERKLAEKLVDPNVFVAVLSSNSKVVYVIDERIDGYHYVSRLPVPFPLSTDCNVDSALEQSARRDYKLSEARITLRRPPPNGKGEERVFPIACDPSTDLITRETNHPLLPGDRIFVTPPGVLAAATQYASAYAPPPGYRDSNAHATPQPAVATQAGGHAATYAAAPAAPQAVGAAPKAHPPATPADGSVAFKIIVLEDPNGHLAEIESLSDGYMLDETGTTRDALRLLEKNGLVKCIASPQLTSRLGETCEMRMDSPGEEKGDQLHTEFAINVCARRVRYTKLLVEIQMDRQADGKDVAIDTRAKLESGQTIIVAAKGRPAKSEGEAIKPRTYLVLTPTLVE